MAVLAWQQVVGAVVQFPTRFFIGNPLPLILRAAQHQVFVLRQARHPTAVRLRAGLVGPARQREAARREVLGALCAAKADQGRSVWSCSWQGGVNNSWAFRLVMA